MILEVAILNLRPGASADVERAFGEAQAISAAIRCQRIGNESADSHSASAVRISQ
jgi:hypothetical protein